MIVLEGGKGKIDQTMQVVVTSVLQTAAGLRMIFAKIKFEQAENWGAAVCPSFCFIKCVCLGGVYGNDQEDGRVFSFAAQRKYL